MATLKELYDEGLRESGMSILENYDVADVLREIDPTAYRCGMVDFTAEAECFQCDICGGAVTAENLDNTEDDEAVICSECHED